MDFAHTARSIAFQNQLNAFMADHVEPAEATIAARNAIDPVDPTEAPPELHELKRLAKAEGLWNLFLPDEEYGAGLSNTEYAPLAEIMGRVIELAPEATNCSAPDTGNMEVLARYGNHEQQQQWLEFFDHRVESRSPGFEFQTTPTTVDKVHRRRLAHKFPVRWHAPGFPASNSST